jgi:hypothetical protein
MYKNNVKEYLVQDEYCGCNKEFADIKSKSFSLDYLVIIMISFVRKIMNVIEFQQYFGSLSNISSAR